MTRPFISLGSAPCDEECAQVGTPDYRANAYRECQSYLQAIRNYLGQEPDGAQLDIKAFDHDFGAYFEVVCYYDEANEAAADYAFRCERQAPHTWEEGSVKRPPRAGGRSSRRR